MRTTFVAILAAALGVVCAACTAAHQPTEVSGGIYDLTVRGEADACSPARETGALGAVGVVAVDDIVSLQVPDAIGAEGLFVSLDRSSGFHGESTVPLRGCVGATLTRSWTVVDGRSDTFAVAYAETWAGLSGCGDAMRAIMPAAPSADCHADLTLDFRMREACAAPCEVGLTAAGPACFCD